MSNLYYNYRGENAGQRGPAPNAPSQQHLVAQKDPTVPLSSYSVAPVQQGVQLGQSATLPSAQPAPVGFSSSQAWAADQSIQQQQHHQQTSQHQAQPNQHQHSLVNTAYPTSSQTQRSTGNHMMNGTRAAQLGSRRAPPYEDSLFQMMGKGFPDKSARSTGPVSSSSLPLSHAAALDHYQQMGSGTSSNVFDPSEFPSLGGGLRAQGGIPMTAATLLTSASATDASGIVGSGLHGQSMNGLGPYDMYGMGSYGDGRAKAVDAVTGSSASAEFNMQSEDFPALGGKPGSGAVRANMMNSGPNGPSLAVSTGGRLGPVSGIDKAGLADGYYDGATVGGSHTQQLHSISARGHGRPDQAGSMTIMGRIGQPSSEFKGSDVLENSGAPSLSRKGQPRAPQESERSPTKGLHPRAAHHASRAEPGVSDVDRKRGNHELLSSADSRARPSQGADDGRRGLANGDALGMSGFASGAGGKPQSSTSLITRMAGHQAHGDAKPQRSVLPADQFGMKGLLQYVGAEAEGTDANMLSIGVDLTMLGLDLNSTEPLHRTFANPWEGGQGSVPGLPEGAGSSQKNEEPDYKLPTCYYMQPPALKNSHFSKFQLQTLFYVFYNMPRDVLQVLAAIELYNRKWKYHKDLKLWFTREPEVLQGYERGAYIYFDIKSWEQRPFHDANQAFIQGLMTEEEVRSVPMPGQRSSAS